MRDRLIGKLLDIPTQTSLSATVGDHYLSPNDPANRPVRKELSPAAVLVPIVAHPEGETVLLTKRTDHLRTHSGQVSFPGGRVETGDKGPVETALRETEEEIGLHRSHIEVIGALDIYETGTGFAITPIVGIVRPGFSLVLDDYEVADAFEVPLDFFLDPANHTMQATEWQGAMRHYYDMPYDGYRIWGATAGMLVNLHQILTA